MSARQQPYNWAETLSDAKAVEQEIATMGDGSLHHYCPPGSLHVQLGSSRVPLTTARSEGTAATHDQQNWGSRGAGNEPRTTQPTRSLR
jgi:hypothetical protein